MNELTVVERFEGHPIAFRKDDAFVNLTEMCRVFGKEARHFLKTEPAKEVAQSLESENSGNSAVFTVRGRTDWSAPAGSRPSSPSGATGPSAGSWHGALMFQPGAFQVPTTLSDALQLAADQARLHEQAQIQVAANLVLNRKLTAELKDARPKVVFFNQALATAEQSRNQAANAWGCVPTRC